MKKVFVLGSALAFTLVVGAVSPAFSMGDDDADDSGNKCKKGEVWDKKAKKCVKKSSVILPDDELYRQGAALALAGQYDRALEVLALVKNQNDPRVLNYTGYSNRKLGRLDTAFGYYKKALDIDPNFVLAREYLGEGYVAAGRIDLAKGQLTEIAARCGTTCEEYQELAEHIEQAAY
jgi:tetratricopeptide (TPR) repeat protein